jgi:regulator of replication initiation timing
MQHLLHGARGVGWVIPLLTDAARALDAAGDALQQIADDLSTISANTARALSDTTEMKRHLRAITEREQILRREVDALKLQLARQRPTHTRNVLAKKPAGKKRRIKRGKPNA